MNILLRILRNVHSPSLAFHHFQRVPALVISSSSVGQSAERVSVSLCQRHNGHHVPSQNFSCGLLKKRDLPRHLCSSYLNCFKALGHLDKLSSPHCIFGMGRQRRIHSSSLILHSDPLSPNSPLIKTVRLT